MKMKLWKKAVALLLGSTLLFGMTACGDSSPTSSTADSGDTVKVGLLHSLSGTMAISETSVRDAELLAIEEINAAGGVLGKQIEAVEEDGASEPSKFAEKAQKLLQDDKVATIFGCWTSASRKAVKPVVEGMNGLLWYPVQYEGMESSENIMYMGAAPNQQVTGSSPVVGFMGGFPSGQRGQTVNLLATLSKVRILLRPFQKINFFWWVMI